MSVVDWLRYELLPSGTASAEFNALVLILNFTLAQCCCKNGYGE